MGNIHEYLAEACDFEIFYDVSELISEDTISICGNFENGFKIIRFGE